MGLMPENESEKYLNIFKKVLSGTQGKNLIDITFSTKQVAGPAPEHALLMDLRKASLKDQEPRRSLFRKIIDSVDMETNYLILLGCDAYDVPFKSKDDSLQHDAGNETFTYIICAICPVKETKPNLHYVNAKEAFHDGGMLQAVSNPEIGFMFPSFDNRSANIYNAVLYSRDTGESHQALVDAIFNAAFPMPADEQKGLFGAVLRSTLGEDCNVKLMQKLHSCISDSIRLNQEAKSPDPVMLTVEEIQAVLRSCAAPEEKVIEFKKVFESEFGAGTTLNAQNIVDIKRFEVRTEDAIIKVAPEKQETVEVRTIGGVDYLLIPVNEGVEVNGVLVASVGDAKRS